MQQQLRVWMVMLGVTGCGEALARIPDSGKSDSAPTITINATPLVPNGPGAGGDIEPSGVKVSTTASVKVSRGKGIMLIGYAVNPGGVAKFSMTISSNHLLTRASKTNPRQPNNTAPNTIALTVPDGTTASDGTINFIVSEPVTVLARAENFNSQSSTITVTYVPTDL